MLAIEMTKQVRKDKIHTRTYNGVISEVDTKNKCERIYFLYVPVTVLSCLWIFSHLIFIMTLWGWFYNYSHLWQRGWVTGPNSQSWWMVELQFSFRSLAPEVSALCCAASDLALSYLLTNKKLKIRPATPFNAINRRIKQFSISFSWG